MNNSTFVARLTRGAVASSIALGCLVAEKRSAVVDVALQAGGETREVMANNFTNLGEADSSTSNASSVTISLREDPKEWTKRMEREFRELAFNAATGTLTSDQRQRLGLLSALRDRLIAPRTSEEVLLELRRNRMLERISEALRCYVEFQGDTGKKRSATV